MRNILSIIEDTFAEVKIFLIKLWKTSKYLFNKIRYNTQVYFKLLFYYINLLIAYLIYIPVYLIHGISWFFRHLYETIKIVSEKLFAGLRYIFFRLNHFMLIVLKIIKHSLKYLYINTLSMIKKTGETIIKAASRSHWFILTLIVFVFSSIISIFKSIIVVFKIFIYALLNKSYELDEKIVVTIKPPYNLPRSLWKGYKASIESLKGSKEEVTDEDQNFLPDLINYVTIFWIIILGFPLLLILIVVTVPISLIIGVHSILVIPDDENDFVDYIRNRIIGNGETVETSILLNPVRINNFDIKWSSSDESIMSNKGILNNAKINELKQSEFKHQLNCNIRGKELNTVPLELKIHKNQVKNALINTYKNLQLPEYVNEDIHFENYKTNPKIQLDIKSINNSIVNDKGEILTKDFKKEKKVHFKVIIKYDNKEMKKRIKTKVYLDNTQEYLNRELNNIPNSLTLRKGKVPLNVYKEVKALFYGENEGVISKNGYVHPSDYDVEDTVHMELSLDEYTVSKDINIFRKGTKKGLRNELRQINVPKVEKDSSQIILPQKTEIGADGFSCDIDWYYKGEKVSHRIEIPTVIKKPYIMSLKAKIIVNGIEGIKKVDLRIPRRTNLYACQRDLDCINVEINKNQLILPKKGKKFNSKITWLSATPSLISSKGELRKEYMIKRSQSKTAIMKAFVRYRTKTITKTYKYNISNGKLLAV